MMFISFDPAIESLVDYLGNAREYLDLMLELGGEDTEIVPGSQAYSMKANWKLLVENSMDGYHAMPTHQRFFNQCLADIAWIHRAGRDPNFRRPPHARLARPAIAERHHLGREPAFAHPPADHQCPVARGRRRRSARYRQLRRLALSA